MSPLLALALLAPQESAGPVLSRMLAKYLTAESGAYRIVTTQAARGASLVTTTVLQWDGDKFAILQERGGSEPKSARVVADGKTFSYDRPEGLFGPRRFVESVEQNGIVQSRLDMYVAARESLVERPPVLDILTCSRDDVKADRLLWSPMVLDGERVVKGKRGTKTKGQFRLVPGGPYAGELEMVVGEDGSLLRYATRQQVAPPPDSGVREAIEVLTVTDVEPIPPDPSRYRHDGMWTGLGRLNR